MCCVHLLIAWYFRRIQLKVYLFVCQQHHHNRKYNYHEKKLLSFSPLQKSILDFDPISLAGGSYIEFDLEYDYFFHSKQLSQSLEGADPNVAQTVNISILAATDPLVGVLFYSKTDNSVQRLEVNYKVK